MPLSPAGGLSEGAPGKQAGRRGWWFTRWVRRRGGPDKPESGRRAGLLAGVRGVSPAGDARADPTQMRRRPAEGADVEEGVSSEAGPPLPAGGRVFGQVGSRGSG